MHVGVSCRVADVQGVRSADLHISHPQERTQSIPGQ
jgi:hypothetical protein